MSRTHKNKIKTIYRKQFWLSNAMIWSWNQNTKINSTIKLFRTIIIKSIVQYVRTIIKYRKPISNTLEPSSKHHETHNQIHESHQTLTFKAKYPKPIKKTQSKNWEKESRLDKNNNIYRRTHKNNIAKYIEQGRVNRGLGISISVWGFRGDSRGMRLEITEFWRDWRR